MIRFGPYSYALAFGALNGAAVAALLLRTRTNRAANRVLAGLLAVVVLRLMPYILGYAGFYDAYPWLSFAPFDLPLAIGPLLWLYVTRLTNGGMPRRWGWHLLPAGAHFLVYFALFAFASQERKTAIVVAVIDPFVAPALTGAALAGLAAYGGAALLALRRYQRWLDDHVSNREEFRLHWLRALLVIMAALGLVWLGFAVTDGFVTPLSYFDEFPFYLTQALAVWLLGLLSWRDAELRYPTPPDRRDGGTVETPAGEDGGSTRKPAQDWAAMGARYLEALRAGEWWRDPQLSLASLARHLSSNSSYVSRALNQGLGQSFNECVNRLRAESVAVELRAGSTRELVQLGFDAGFNSKASFQRAFVQFIGQTPSAFRDAVRTSQITQNGP